MSAFDELMAEAQAGKGDVNAASKSSAFAELMAEAKAPQPRQVGRYPSRAPADSGPSYAVGDQAMDIAKEGMAGVSRGAEFLTDVANFPLTLKERHDRGMESTATRDSFLPRALGGGLENYIAGAFSPTDRGKQIADMYDTDAYDPTVPEGEGSTGYKVLKKAAGLAGELSTTALLGGAKMAPTVAKSIPTSSALGAVGGEMYGDMGEMGGVIAGALAHEPKAIAQLLSAVTAKITGAGKRVGELAVEGKRAIKSGDTWETASNSERRAALRETIKNMTGPDGAPITAEQIDMVIPRLEAALKRGEKGTTAQILDDMGLRQFELDEAGRTRGGVADIKRIDADIERDALKSIEDIAPEGVAAQAPAFPKTLADEARSEAAGLVEQPRIARLEAAAAEETSRAPFTQDRISTPDTGRALAESVDQIKQKEYDSVKAKWAKLDDVDQVIPADALRTKYQQDLFKAVDNDPNLARAFEKDFPKTVERIAELEGDVSIGALSDVLSLLSKESVGTSTNPAVIDAVKDSLYASIEKGSKRRAAAAKAHRDYMEKWGPKTTTGKALKGEPTDFGVAVVTTGPKGATRLNRLLENADGKVAGEAQDVLRARFRDEVMDADGTINPTKAATFERKYKHHLDLDAMKDLREEVSNASSRSAALRDTSKALTEAETASTRALADVDKSDIAILGDTGTTDKDVAAAVKRMLAPGKGKDPAKELGNLMKAVESNPQAKANIRRALADDFQNSVTSKGDLSQDAYKTFKRDRDMYEQSGAFTKAELDNIDKQFTESQKLFMLTDKEKLVKLPPEKRRVAEAVAALTGAKVGAQLFGSPLIGAAMGRRFAAEKFKELSSDKARKLAFEMMVNPEKYVEWTKKLAKPNISPKEADSVLADLLTTALAASRTVPIEEEK